LLVCGKREFAAQQTLDSSRIGWRWPADRTEPFWSSSHMRFPLARLPPKRAAGVDSASLDDRKGLQLALCDADRGGVAGLSADGGCKFLANCGQPERPTMAGRRRLGPDQKPAPSIRDQGLEVNCPITAKSIVGVRPARHVLTTERRTEDYAIAKYRSHPDFLAGSFIS